MSDKALTAGDESGVAWLEGRVQSLLLQLRHLAAAARSQDQERIEICLKAADLAGFSMCGECAEVNCECTPEGDESGARAERLAEVLEVAPESVLSVEQIRKVNEIYMLPPITRLLAELDRLTASRSKMVDIAAQCAEERDAAIARAESIGAECVRQNERADAANRMLEEMHRRLMGEKNAALAQVKVLRDLIQRNEWCQECGIGHQLAATEVKP